jgi:hypothetical protein
MGIFGLRKVKACDKPIEERTVPELIETIPHVNPMNSDSIIKAWNDYETSRRFPKFNKGSLGDQSFWMNPHNQTSFEYGQLTHQDFIDWANGTGKAVRGETQEQKDRYMRYAKAHTELDLGVFIYAEYLWMIDSDSKTQWRHRYQHSAYKNPINLSNRRDSQRVIKETFSALVQPLLRDIKDHADWNKGRCTEWVRKLSNKHRDYMNAVCTVLAMGGHGYYDACNTPTEIENLSWSKDLVWAKAYSLYLEEIDPGIVECIQWCQENRHKLKS